MEKELPSYKTQGVEFIIDVNKGEVREVANPENIYSMLIMNDLGDAGYGFDYFDKSTGKTLAIVIPQFVSIDPHGMALKYNKSIDVVKTMSDFEVMVDQDLLTKRLKQGQIPSVSIAGTTFYADARVDLLRPKDDFTTQGIRFDDLDDYYVLETNSYLFPYDPKKHDLAIIDWEKIVEYPKDLLFIEIPDVKVLDPVGWNRRHGIPDTDDLKVNGLKLEFKANIIPWTKAGLDEQIAENRMKQAIKNDVKEKAHPSHKRKGPKI